MAMFGEIVIPSSRILWDDEDDIDASSRTRAAVEWHGNTVVPAAIPNLLIVETTKLTHIAQTCVDEASLYCSIKAAKLRIYKLRDNNYLVVCDDVQDVCVAEVADNLIPWVENSERVTALTSASLSTYYCEKREETELCIIRALANRNSQIYAPKLETPNLITGVTAGVLSYCKHIEKPATIYICYMESRELDSASAAPIINLLNKCHVSTDKPFTFKPRFHSDSNLYM